MAKPKIKEIIKDIDNQVLILVNLMIFDEFKKSMIETVIEEEHQTAALAAWEGLTDDEKMFWIKEVAIPQFKEGELEKFLIKGTRYMKLSKHGRQFLQMLKDGAK